MSTIEAQVKLPVRVAFDVVLQGIQIRFGRSMVTIMGVVFGIAFLMSMLTGQVINDGVREEDRLRLEAKRMCSFLTAEMGPAAERQVGVVQIGPLSEEERRLLRALENGGLASFRWAQTGAAETYQPSKAQLEPVDFEGVGEGASAVLIVGEGNTPEADWQSIFSNSRQRVLASARNELLPEEGAAFTEVKLHRELREDEIEKMAAEGRQRSFRARWIIIVSLLVTVIGISNAMLMSVTERFREIGAMKCLGALSGFIRQIFLIESCLMGTIGGMAGSVFGVLFAIAMYGFTYGFGMVFASLNWGLLSGYVLLSVAVGVVLSIIAAIYPARVAAGMVPADALRSNI